MGKEYQPHFKAPEQFSSDALWFTFHQGKILVRMAHPAPEIYNCTHPNHHGLEIAQEHYLGTYGGEHCYAAELAENQNLPDGHAMLGLRDMLGHVDDTLAGISGRALQILE